MLNKIKAFWQDEEGLGTLELLLIVAVLVGIALLFGNTLKEWVVNLLGNIDPTPTEVPTELP